MNRCSRRATHNSQSIIRNVRCEKFLLRLRETTKNCQEDKSTIQGEMQFNCWFLCLYQALIGLFTRCSSAHWIHTQQVDRMGQTLDDVSSNWILIRSVDKLRPRLLFVQHTFGWCLDRCASVRSTKSDCECRRRKCHFLFHNYASFSLVWLFISFRSSLFFASFIHFISAQINVHSSISYHLVRSFCMKITRFIALQKQHD